jgi:type IV pilus assembly protein PilC
MPKFNYTARDLAGQASSGAILAADENELRRMLRMNDLYLVKARRGGGDVADGESAPHFFDSKVTLQDLVIATRQLGTTIRAGLPLLEALRIVGSQSNKPALTRAFFDMEQAALDGKSLSIGMSKHPKLFNSQVIALVEAGEVSGTLEQTLGIAADQLDREYALRRKVKAATLYPKLVVLACFGTVVGMMTLVVPVFSKVYEGVHAQLPAPTMLLMSMSGIFIHWWWAIAAAVAAAVYGAKRYGQTVKGRTQMDIVSLKIPILGPLMRKVAVARVVQTLAGALKGGVPILMALEICANTAGNAVIQNAVIDASHHVREGAALATELERTGQFPLLVTRMVAAGEATGRIDSMLEEINRFYEQDIAYSVEQLTLLIEPFMTVAVGTIVLLILLALYMPIFSLGPALLGKH